MKIAFFEIEGWEKEMLKKGLKGHRLNFFDKTINEVDLKNIEKYNAISVFIKSKIDEKILSQLKNLKVIATRSTGFDHIKISACKKKKINVFNVPTYGENTVAEHTFELILTLSRNVHKAYLRILKRDYSIDGLIGFDLKGKTIGVIGAGNIGKHVIRIARGFEMNVLAADNHLDKFLAEELNFKYVNLDELLKKSDIITLHIPLTKENFHLINKKTIEKMKKGVIIINTSRGDIIDTEALIHALEKKHVGGVGLDVIEGEEFIKEEKELLYEKKNKKAIEQIIEDSLLIMKDNVVFTPHIAFYSKEALNRIISKTIDNLNNYKEKNMNKEAKIC